MSPQLGLQTSYIYMNAFILAFGVWSIICPESIDAISMVCFKNTFVCVCVCEIMYICVQDIYRLQFAKQLHYCTVQIIGTHVLIFIYKCLYTKKYILLLLNLF